MILVMIYLGRHNPSQHPTANLCTEFWISESRLRVPMFSYSRSTGAMPNLPTKLIPTKIA